MTANIDNYLEDIPDIGSPGYLPVISMAELYDSTFESKPAIIEGLLYPGTYLFVGAPKQGKSFLMLQLAYHVSSGLPLWGYAVRQGTVLYLALEDDHPRLQNRLYRMFGTDVADNLYLCTWAKQVGGGLAEQLEAFAAKHPGTVLIIIDSHSRWCTQTELFFLFLSVSSDSHIAVLHGKSLPPGCC